MTPVTVVSPHVFKISNLGEWRGVYLEIRDLKLCFKTRLSFPEETLRAMLAVDAFCAGCWGFPMALADENKSAHHLALFTSFLIENICRRRWFCY